MQGKNVCFGWIAAVCLTALLAGPCLAGTTGLAVDSRGCTYTADSETGCILCRMPDSDPVILARIDDTPTALSVDWLRTVFVGAASGRIYAVTLDGSVSLVHTCEGAVTGLDLDRDNNLIAALKSGRVVRIKREDFVWESR